MDWQYLLYSVPAVLIGLTVHEFCHGFAAYKLGDSTAKDQGRLTFNPLKHIDIIGLLFIVFAGFGWAKPVQFNPQNLSRPRRDKALIALAGPVSNLLLGILFCLILRFLVYVIGNDGSSQLFVHGVILLYYGAAINFGLFVFNILPIPPLDGSHIFFSGLNLRPETEQRIMRIGMPLLFVIIVIQNTTNITILPIGKVVDALISLFL
ncbi:site-2 protease family protein [Breznakiella homolactica]|uniref:Site-2 protease family protein n=1 Tax=Breznakiella homolactica TaxID=2798577 RepID=A0A7T7XPF9_9SPIR|nr:site-2 protease family protein [Breznakiella homolactica]QQO10058.1 site-2 protease family protein [Breznakiella homolactica]